MAPNKIGFLYFFILLIYANLQLTACLQCYSCKGSGSNELEANIECLQKAYLEQCEEFYDYYNEVEDSDYNQYDDDYYYSDDEEYIDDNAGYIYPESSEEVEAERDRDADESRERDLKNSEPPVKEEERSPAPSRTSTNERVRVEDEEELEVQPRPRDDPQEDLDPQNSRRPPAESYRGGENPPFAPGGNLYRGGSSVPYRPPARPAPPPPGRRQRRASRDKEYEYEYEYYDEPGNVTNHVNRRLDDADTTGHSHDDLKDVDSHDPKKSEHYCYSMTQKTSWETYTVEKGCKKIVYCEAALKNKPEWTHPWNFCCDRSRCNVKLVKDKPQRVYGMGCRRTDDCIQGHSSRPVCPQYFKSCPRISHALIKMECRTNARTMASLKSLAKYRHLYREKKCYCAKGYFPKGPICTNGSPVTLAVFPMPLLSFAVVIVSTHL